MENILALTFGVASTVQRGPPELSEIQLPAVQTSSTKASSVTIAMARKRHARQLALVFRGQCEGPFTPLRVYRSGDCQADQQMLSAINTKGKTKGKEEMLQKGMAV